MLEKEYQYFKTHQRELVEKYPGRYIVIVDEEVTGDYETYAEAYETTIEKHDLGTFLIQECVPGTNAYTSYISSKLNPGTFA